MRASQRNELTRQYAATEKRDAVIIPALFCAVFVAMIWGAV